MISRLILSGPGQAPSPTPTNQWVGLQLTWEGPDGSVWNLNDKAAGVLLSENGVEGLHNPRMTKYKSRSRAVPGARRRGWRAEEREVFWRVWIWADNTAQWLDRNNAFFSSIHPDRPGIWRVKARETRELALTGVFDDTHVFEVDPAQRGWVQYGVTLEADQPYWQGPLITRGPWRAPDPQPFFPGPPFTISAGSAFGSATVPNPGDVPAHGVWWVRGPLEGVSLGVGDAVVTVPFEVPSGQMLRIDTDPRRPTATLGAAIDPSKPESVASFSGVNVTRDLGLQAYAAIPPGRSVDLHVNATGTGAVSFHLRPLYFRAF